MELRIKEICREKKITMQEIANRLGISNVNLSNSLNGNPTLGRLRDVSAILGVEMWQLFRREQDISGMVKYNGSVYSIDSFQNLYDLTEKIKAENEKLPVAFPKE